MRNSYLLVLFLITTTLGVVSCKSDPTAKFIGTWQVVDVDASFDEQRFTPEMLKQVVQMEKQVFFKFVNDTMMNIITLDQTNSAYWYYDAETGLISYRFAGPASQLHELGTYQNGSIIATSQTALGKLTITYEKK
jgi:hypothetical protein